MNASEFYTRIPSLEIDEIEYLQSLTSGMGQEKINEFLAIYNNKRVKPETFLLTTILGFFLVAGIQRFITNSIGMGILYLLTGGLCLIGTIYDLINYKKLTFEFNREQALESMRFFRDPLGKISN